ncbi:LysR family transcriptional regulator [Roseicitreum antarcticum]|uniref:Transcriptional regulator, LysR family n=1 Tax=Roseicitreum antarcticum TaxID=564137 RepID=A0A1H2TMS1_9RHOB|nr:LysR family transcriptional regulator [Roseicitreum antarcticum]SDW45005.1 transcriptional regulator, LysR family [Roseicitreum antarcticum]
MRDRLPPLRAMRVLEAVWKHGSIAAAAENLNVTQSAIGHQLRQIEEWSGVALMIREGRRIHLTDAGESLALVVHRGFSAIRHEVDRLTMRERLPVTLAAMPLVAQSWLLPSLPQFHAAHPQIALHLATIQSDQPMTPEPDVAILFSLSGDLPAEATAIIGGRAVPVCAPDYLVRHPIRQDRDILAGRLLQDEDSRMWSDWAIAAKCAVPAPPEQALLYLAGSNLLTDAALAGQGIALCREALISGPLADGRLIALSDTAIDTGACYYYTISTDGRKKSTVGVVVAWLQTLAA